MKLIVWSFLYGKQLLSQRKNVLLEMRIWFWNAKISQDDTTKFHIEFLFIYVGIHMYPAVFSLSNWFWDCYKLSWKDFEMIR